MTRRRSFGIANTVLLVAFAATGALAQGAPQATDPASGPPPTLTAPRFGSPAGASQAAGQPAPSLANAHQFDSKVRPILAQNCYKCHTDEAAGGLRRRGGGRRILADQTRWGLARDRRN